MKERVLILWGGYRVSLLLIFIGMLAAAGIEMIYNVPALSESRRNGKETVYNLADLKVSNMELKENILVAGDEGCEIHLYPEGKYVNKLIYSYGKKDEEIMLNATITVVTYDAYGNETTETITDNNPYIINESIVNIRAKAKEICITIPEGLKGLEIKGIHIKNEPQFNGMRWLFFTAIFVPVLLLWKNRNTFIGKAERIFLLIGLTAGTMLVVIMPLNKVGFDEETHFRNAYNIKLSAEVSSTLAIEELKVVSLANWPYNIAQSKEERDIMEAYYQDAGDYTSKGSKAIKVSTKISTVGAFNYIFMALGIKMGKLLHLPFTAVFTLGRLFNMWSYITLIYFAIKKLPIGKYIMAVLALMPTPMFQAAVYSCDPVITGFMYLGLAYLIAELIEKENKITIKNGIILLGSLGFGMVAKAVYVPIMALGFLIPAEKFKNRKQKMVFRITNVVCILGLLATFVVPMLFAAESIGDPRGGDVSVMGQVSLILSQPLGYLKVWFDNMSNVFWDYSFGEGSLGTLGHLTASTCVPMIGLLLIFTIMTDNIERSEQDLILKQKWSMFIAAMLSVAFVWGSLYLAFNEVGSTFMGGVQGRYFIPLLFVFYMLIRRKNMKNNMRPVNYHFIVFGCTMYIAYKTIYDCILQPYCF